MHPLVLMHDTVEDTDTTPEELEREFGGEIRAIVMDVTDDKTLEKAARTSATTRS
jgi:guanosine-3',5'-bis(diphosphate) 3'-pyrophosphohydrolase